MSDRIKSLTVVLTDNMRDDDAQRIMDAISIYAGVVSVAANVANPDHYTAVMSAKVELWEKLRDVVMP